METVRLLQGGSVYHICCPEITAIWAKWAVPNKGESKSDNVHLDGRNDDLIT